MASTSSRLLLWKIPAVVAALATLLFAAGFALALRGAAGKPLGETPAAPRGTPPAAHAARGRLLLVLGDSLARGTGDETGRGLARELLDGLRRRGPAELANLAVNGAESDEVRELVGHANVRDLAASAGWIFVSVGGNDLSHAVPRLAEGPPGAPLESVARARDRFGANLREILETLRAANPDAPIRVLGLYDPFEGAAAPARVGASVILQWNAVAEETALAYPGVAVVPTFDLFQGRPDRLAIDRFHPSRAGYVAIATRVLQTW